MKFAALAGLAVALGSVSCGSTPHPPFFRLDITYDLETSTGAPTTCQALNLGSSNQVVGTLALAMDNSVTVTGIPNRCGFGLVGDSGLPDGGNGMDYLELTGYGGELEDAYVQLFDSQNKLVAFGRSLGAVPANVTDNSIIQIHIALKQPTVPLCGDGVATEPGKTGCDDYLDNNCCNCNTNSTGCSM
jgi:hypothetical protein